MHHPLLLAALVSTVLLAACGSGNSDSSSRDTLVLAEVTPVLYGNDTTPNYIFSSSEGGTISWGGACVSATIAAVSGDNTVTFMELDYGIYSNCTLKVTGMSGNVSSTLAVSSFSVASKPYNDTGIIKCGDIAYSYTGYSGSGIFNNDIDCTNGASPSSTGMQDGFEITNGLDIVPAGQDAHFGRDANPATNSDADGHKGFSFTKLSAVNGLPLAVQNGTWSDVGSEEAGTQWGCVQDNVTGLVWEIKTNDGGLRDKDWTYTWYNSTNSNDGGDYGVGDTGAGTTTGFETNGGIYDGSDYCYNSSRCDTEKFVADMNAGSGLCGAIDWRMPTAEELFGLVANDRFYPSIDSEFIPNIMSAHYWSASPAADSSTGAWSVGFSYGYESWNSKYSSNYVRLVRGGH